MNPVDEALAYAERRGWVIFPTQLVPRQKGGVDKIPCIKDWPNAASREPNQIRKWWRIWPNAVPSIVTGPRNGIIVLDIDIKSRTDPDGSVIITRSGLDTLEELGWWCLPATPIVHTRSGGLHLYFRATTFKIRNSTGNYGLGPNVDVRGWNGQAVLPAATSGYWWDPHYNFDSVAMMPAPSWFDYRQPKSTNPTKPGNNHPRFNPDAVLADACRRIRTAPEGTRHDTYRHETFKVARLVSAGLLNGRRAYNDLAAEVMALGKIADGHTGRVAKYFEMAWSEGLAASRRATR